MIVPTETLFRFEYTKQWLVELKVVQDVDLSANTSDQSI